MATSTASHLKFLYADHILPFVSLTRRCDFGILLAVASRDVNWHFVIIGHVSNIHPDGFCNQTTAQLCRANKTPFLNLKTRDINPIAFQEMDDTGALASLPIEAASSTANSEPGSPENQNYPTISNPLDVYSDNNEEEVMTGTGERVPLSTLKAMLQRQLEYYFSKENLSTDEYLQSQMDNDNYVAISTIANFNQVRRLTDDINLVVEVLRDSLIVQVDEAGEKVRPNPRTRVLILREIPHNTPVEEIQELFSGANCPKFTQCMFAINDTWYVLFESDEDTQRAYQYIREENKMFRGKPVMVRVKAKTFTSAPFTSSKNGMTNTQETENYNGQNVAQPQQQSLQYPYSVPNESYNNQPVCSPFYPPTMLQAWAPSQPQFDLGTVLQVNGLTPTTAYRPLPGNNNRHNYTSTRERPVKAYTPQNYNFSRSERNSYFNRGPTPYLGRQQMPQPAASFPGMMNASNCAAYDYMPFTTTRRNVNHYGVESFFTAPTVYYNKLPSVYPHASQTHRNPILVSRNQLSVLNCQEPSYLAVGNSNSLPYSKDPMMSGASGSKQSLDSQVKENIPNQRQQRSRRYYRENGSSNSRNYSDGLNNTYNKSVIENEAKPESPKFDLETSSFPPLPGCMDTETTPVDVYESRLSDIVKGTVKPATRDTKTQTSESGLVCTTKDSSTITTEETVVLSEGAFTPPDSPDVVVETGTAELLNAETCPKPNEWDHLTESLSESTVCNTSINPVNIVPEVPSYKFSLLQHTTTNSMVNGSVTVTESSTTANVPEEPKISVPIETISAKPPKTKQLDSVPKNSRSCDLPSPKNKTPDISSNKNKFDKAPVANKHRTNANKNSCDSSSSNKNDHVQAISKTAEHGTSKNSEAFHSKEKMSQGHGKNKVDSDSNMSNKISEPEPILSVNGHAESESNSEDEKPLKKLTYSEVAILGLSKSDKVSKETIVKDVPPRQQHRQQENVAQNRQMSNRGPFREERNPKGRMNDSRTGSRELRDRRKPPRVPAAGQ
ncbi:hypothetical protein CDAR_53373 [Caerostris darwini]|uniref:HTH La-type RNA-binding domain-containing protein n=1 Tax=Caerostris darwini TaxID=1538125 RepID=A0AAV4TGM7_9ARAC|nr:hypothetical protein CDAR_53373 [Caerostris darwini]